MIPRYSCGSGGFGDELISHLAKALDLGLHDVAGLEEGIRALADATAGACACRKLDPHILVMQSAHRADQPS
jgi:hypothetical protein